MVQEKLVILKLNAQRKSPVLPEMLKSEVIKKIGSEFRPGTRDCIRGLDSIQERLILPEFIGLQANDPQFPLRAKEYWADFGITPTEEGITLNIATDVYTYTDSSGNSKEIQMPLNPDDFMIYRIAMQSSKVAKTPEELDMLDNFDFYLIDLEEEKNKKANKFETAKKATVAFAKLIAKEDDVKIDCVIQLLKNADQYFDFSSSRLEKEMFLDEKAKANPRLFLEILEDKDLETKALLRKALEYQIVALEGKDYFYEDAIIGPEKAAVEWFKKQENSAKVLAIKSKLESLIPKK